MDSTIFIRSRRVLALWLVVPLLAVAVTELGSRAFYSYQQVAYLRNQSLETLIPEMTAEEARFDQFIGGYQISTPDASSVESAYIELLTAAAEEAKFNITSIRLVQEKESQHNTIRLAAQVSGLGPCSRIVEFLQTVKKKDSLIYEEQLELTRSFEDSELLDVQATLGKIYIASEGGFR
jgi:hypothetical protein